jgi:4-amino-4-deoxy-L-arabinose transferase-like glycosyltransferase
VRTIQQPAAPRQATPNPRAPDRLARWLLAALALVLAVRLATLGTYPLADTSEARYGEIARVMRETGNWVTPQETPGAPFWAKPPLYAWLSATSISVLRVNEFALRLPSLLCGFAVLALCAVWTAALARRPSPPAPGVSGLPVSCSAPFAMTGARRAMRSPGNPNTPGSL